MRNKMPVLSHSPCGFAQPQTANAATHKSGGSGFVGERLAPLRQPQGGFRRHNSAALCRSAPLRPLHPCRRFCGRLNKTCILSPQAAVCRRSGGGGSFAPLTPCRRWRHIQAACGGGIVPPPTGGGLACSAAQSSSVRSNRPSLSAAVRKAHQPERIIA